MINIVTCVIDYYLIIDVEAIIDLLDEVPMETDEVSEDAWAKEYRKMMKGEKEKEKRDRFATADFKLPKVTFSFIKLIIPLKSLFIAMSKFIRHYGYFFSLN